MDITNRDITNFTCPKTQESDRSFFLEIQQRLKIARFLVKTRIGIKVGMAKGKRFRWWTLTESDESIEAGLSFSKSWSMLRKWLSRVDDGLEYCIVEHIQGDMKRRNWHVLTYGNNYIPVDDLREYWKSHFLSTISGLQEVKNPIQSAKYLSGYLSGDDKFQRSRFSQDWVFPYWWDFSRFYRNEWGVYVPEAELVRLALLSFEDRRKANMWFDLFIDVREIGWEGIFKDLKDKWDKILEKKKGKLTRRNTTSHFVNGENQGCLL